MIAPLLSRSEYVFCVVFLRRLAILERGRHVFLRHALAIRVFQERFKVCLAIGVVEFVRFSYSILLVFTEAKLYQPVV